MTTTTTLSTGEQGRTVLVPSTSPLYQMLWRNKMYIFDEFELDLEERRISTPTEGLLLDAAEFAFLKSFVILGVMQSMPFVVIGNDTRNLPVATPKA